MSNQDLNFVVDGIDYSSDNFNSGSNSHVNSNYNLENTDIGENNDASVSIPNSVLNFMNQTNNNDNNDNNDNDDNDDDNNDDNNNNDNNDNTDLERAIQASLQETTHNHYTEEEFNRELEEVLEQSRIEEEDRISSLRSNTFSLPILPMSMLPEHLFQYYTKINQSCNKVIVPQEILLHLFPENSDYNDSLDSHIDNGNPIMFQLTGYSFEGTNIDLDKTVIYSLDSFLDIEYIYVTDQCFQDLKLDFYTSCNFKIYNEIIPKGEKIVLEPKQKEFLEIKDQESLLLPVLNKDFRTLQKDQTIRIFSFELEKELEFKIIEINPLDSDIISIIDTDLVVDFSIPEHFIEKPKTKEMNADLYSSLNTTNDFKNDITDTSKLEKTKFPGNGQTVVSCGKTDEEATERALTREEIRAARLKAFSKYN